MAGNDFVMVQLTQTGNDLAQGFPLSVQNGRRAFTFEPGIPVRVERSYEWLAVLKPYHTPQGEPLFELVPEPAPAPTPDTAPETPKGKAKSATASIASTEA